MRKIDRKLNLQKVNMLAENRYLQSKGIIKEGMYEEGMYEEGMGEANMDECGTMYEDDMMNEGKGMSPAVHELADFTDTIPEVNPDGSIRFTTQNGKLAFFVSPNQGTIIMLTQDEMKALFAKKLNELI